MTDVASKNLTAGSAGKLLRGASWIAGARLIVTILGVASTLILARLLMPEDFGLVAIALTTIALLTVMSELSLDNALVQTDSLDNEFYHTAFTLGLLRAAVLAVVVGALAIPIGKLYGDPRLVHIVLALSLTCFISGLANPRMADFKRRLEFAPSQIVGISQKLVGFIVCITVAIIYRSYWALVIGNIAAQLTQVVMGYVLIKYRPRISLSRSKSILGFSVWLTLGSWVQTVNWRSDPLILGYFVPAAALGQLTMAGRVTNLVTQELTSPIALVLFPAFSRMKDDRPRLRRAYMKSMAILSSIALPVSIGLAVTSQIAVPVILGEQWRPAIPYFEILGVTAAIKALQRVQPIAMAMGETRSLFGREFRSFCVRAPLLFAGIYLGAATSIGVLMGALIGRLIAVVFNTAWNMGLIAKISDITIGDQLKSVWRPIVSSCVMALVVISIMTYWDFGTLKNFLQLMLYIILGGSVFAGSMMLSWLFCRRPDGLESLVFEFILSAKLIMKAKFRGKIK